MASLEEQRRAYEAAIQRSGMTDRQRQAYEAALARSDVQQTVPTQRVRSMAQGLTFGVADEAEAAVRSLATGRSYEDVLNEVRGGLKAYQEANPIAATAYEVGGAALPIAAASLFSGGTASAPLTATTLVRTAAIGAGQGGAYAFGTGEGGFAERASRVPGGAIAGGIAAPVADVALRGARVPLVAALDAARRRLGARGASVVEAEIRRIAEDAGVTPDDAWQMVMDGKILADAPGVRDMVRTYRATGGPASATLSEILPRRTAQTRTAAMEEMQNYLVGGADPNVLRQVLQADDVARAAERQAYAPFKGQEAPPEVVAQLGEALRRVPEAAQEVAIALRADTGQSPFFTIGENGAVSFTRAPSVLEVENVRRALNNRATALYRGNMGWAGETVSGVAGELRGLLDVSVPELASTRANAAALRGARDAFEQGQKAFTQGADAAAIEFERLTDPQAIASYRAGVMHALRKKYETGQQASLMGILNNPERKEGAILRSIFPEDQLPDVLRRIDVAASAQATQSRVMGGSDTAITSSLARRQGIDLSAEDISGALSGSPIAMARVGRKVVQSVSPDLTDAQRSQIVNILVSENPDMVRRALQDTSAMAALQRNVEALAETIRRAGVRVAPVGPAGVAGDTFAIQPTNNALATQPQNGYTGTNALR